MDEQKLAQLRDHYDTADLSVDIERARWETDTESDPMVTTSLRLPKSVLDWIRQQAEAEHVKPTALIRRWIEQQRSGHTTDLEVRLEQLVNRLESVVVAEEEVPRAIERATRGRRRTGATSQGRRSAAVGQPVVGHKTARHATGRDGNADREAASKKAERRTGLRLPPPS